jgi:septum formation protein
VLLLASQSPRRRELLAAAGLSFHLYSPFIDETPKRGELPRALVRRLAQQKAMAALVEAQHLGATHVIAADTVVALAKTVMNKPQDDKEAARMLEKLSGRVHHVFTGCSVLSVKSGAQKTIVVATEVKFRKLSAADVARYVQSGEGRDKAGAYAIQGEGAVLIASVRGSYTNVIGLPVQEVLALL